MGGVLKAFYLPILAVILLVGGLHASASSSDGNESLQNLISAQRQYNTEETDLDVLLCSSASDRDHLQLQEEHQRIFRQTDRTREAKAVQNGGRRVRFPKPHIPGPLTTRQGYDAATLPTVDTVGHGSHTASMVAARRVDGVGLARLAGTALGAVPGAQLAIYKACWDNDYHAADVLAEFDDAIADDVDLVSYSICGKLLVPYFEGAMAIGSFHAMRRGVLTIIVYTLFMCARPQAGTKGRSLSEPFRATAQARSWLADIAFSMPLPALTVPQGHFSKILANVKRTRHDASSVGTIQSTETNFDATAPMVASFSSPGPNIITPAILKPDLWAPGVDILAAWTPLSPVSQNVKDNRFAAYNILSSTSMACPHAAGAAAYVKSFHPRTGHRRWSCQLSSPQLTYGAGQLNPGLVYNAREEDYVRMLCSEGYNSTQLGVITGSKATTCPSGTKRSTGQ
ncbi:hypothetical protein PR202_ga28070 [Eleusine coracana subsp. coracana]|uniref:Peptidase S8/S53 domain-containing protein n=1 Tax=Eleusine coracana subsp. coracana TaxID=191504 RepID=A0AAV5DIK7_ELECO|nr:hypothetical protein PR202_ga28070 [Eleusine coracana subsp. coracana]